MMYAGQRMRLPQQRQKAVPPSLDRAPTGTALIGNIGAGNIGARNSSWSTSTGQDTDAPAWCSFSNRGLEQRKGKRIQL